MPADGAALDAGETVETVSCDDDLPTEGVVAMDLTVRRRFLAGSPATGVDTAEERVVRRSAVVSGAAESS